MIVLASVSPLSCSKKSKPSSSPSPVWIVWEHIFGVKGTTVVDLPGNYGETETGGVRKYSGSVEDKGEGKISWEYVGQTEKFGEVWLLEFESGGTVQIRTFIKVKDGNTVLFKDSNHTIRLSLSKP